MLSKEYANIAHTSCNIDINTLHHCLGQKVLNQWEGVLTFASLVYMANNIDLHFPHLKSVLDANWILSTQTSVVHYLLASEGCDTSSPLLMTTPENSGSILYA